MNSSAFPEGSQPATNFAVSAKEAPLIDSMSAASAATLACPAAIVSRVVHGYADLHPLLAWLAEPDASDRPPQQLRNTKLTEIFDDLLNPIIDDATVWERQQAKHISEWLAASAILFQNSKYTQALGIAPRMLASTTLPLYRCLAVGDLFESVQAVRQQTAEQLILLSLLRELGEEFCAWLDTQLMHGQTPTHAIHREFHLDISSTAELLLEAAGEIDQRSGSLTTAGLALLQKHSRTADSTRPGELWSDSQLLWKLAGELNATRAEIVLPRPWIEIPVPWGKIQDHWHRLSQHLLQTLQQSSTGLNPTSSSHGSSLTQAEQAPHVMDVETETAVELGELCEAVATVVSGRKEPSERHGTEQPDQAEAMRHPTPTAGFAECLPKLLLAEISSLSDPAFLNVMRRRLAACRADDRPLCISIVVVTPDDDGSANRPWPAVGGLSRWQQALVNWMAEQPHVAEPFAFLTSSGELIFCVHDLEKNEMTTLIRRALLHVLGGANDATVSDASLNKVNIPARFHAGIAGSSSPGPNLTAEQLVAPALRCLQAAQQQGKTGIKSIEVY
jgi:hypothetical protein